MGGGRKKKKPLHEPLRSPCSNSNTSLRDSYLIRARSVMAATVAQQPVSAQVVGNAFVQQYYRIQSQSPELVHRFYQDISKLGRPDESGLMTMTTTMKAINKKMLSLNYGEFKAEIKSVDAQESYNGGVHVLVTGSLVGKDNMIQNFTQTFFLAPQEKGYFVLNDMFRYVEDIKHHSGNQSSADDVEALLIPVKDPSPVQENHVIEQTMVTVAAIRVETLNPSNSGEVPVAEFSDEVPDDSQLVVEFNSKIVKVPKSYASIVMDTKESAMPLSSPAPASVLAAEITVSGSDAIENGNQEGGGKLKLNTDGSSKGNPGRAGVGGVLRDERGHWLSGFYGRIHDCTCLEAELWAIHRGLKAAFEQGLKNLEVESDSELAVNMIIEGPPSNSPYFFIVKDCKEFMERCEASIKHTLREGNKVADKLANMGVDQDDPMNTLAFPTEELEALLAADLAGVSYMRL